MRLIIDARMLDHSGIGVYLSNVLPGVLRRCARLQPLLLTLPALLARVQAIAANDGEVQPWTVAPLSFAEFAPPPALSRGQLWWSPHFNVPLLSNVALVATVHDILPLSDAGAGLPRRKRIAVRLWLEAIRRRARCVICSTAFTRDEVIRLTRIAAQKTQVVHLGVDRAWSLAIPSSNRADPHIVFVGLVKPHKNLTGLLRAFEMLMATIPHRLVVIGRHGAVRDVDDTALALAQRLAPRVELLEDIPQARLIELVAGADLLVQPSFYEGFGFPPVEAMAAGTPVLAARIGTLTEVCSEAAQYCDPYSAADIAASMQRILDDKALRDRMSALGRERARAFTWENCAAATSDALLAAASVR